MLPKIEKMIRPGLPQVGVVPYGQVHAHSTANPGSTAQNEADYMYRKDINSGFYTHVVGNGRIIQTAEKNRGAWDVGGNWNAWGYASVELIESHKTKDEFLRDYKIYVELLRTLAKEAGIPIKVDAGTTGILSHEYCTYNQPGNASDHVDPYPYLAKWGISRAQFKKDVENGLEDTVKNGWIKEGNVWKWYENGTAFKNGWKKVKGKWYYLDKDGNMKTGWQIIDGRYYKLDNSGAMLEGWLKEGNTWYYLEPSGAMKTGWFKDKAGNWYYLSKPSGAMVTGTVPIDGKTYQFDKNGVCQNP